MSDSLSPDQMREIAEEAAEKALHKTFFLLGIDLDQMESVQAFCADIQFARSLRNIKSRSAGRIWATFLTLGTGAAIVTAIDYLKSYWHK